jgi:hypothetical protein
MNFNGCTIRCRKIETYKSVDFPTNVFRYNTFVTLVTEFSRRTRAILTISLTLSSCTTVLSFLSQRSANSFLLTEKESVIPQKKAKKIKILNLQFFNSCFLIKQKANKKGNCLIYCQQSWTAERTESKFL